MTERPILMSAPMVRSTLDDTKTWTRRVVNPQPPNDPQHDHVDAVGSLHRWWAGRLTLGKQHEARCPYGQPGDRLWVREAWRTQPLFDDQKPSNLPKAAAIRYEADETLRGHSLAGYGLCVDGKLRPSMFMPRWASRITLEVTEVRVERLQDISKADAIAEGIEREPGTAHWMQYDKTPGGWRYWESPIQSYRTLWESINGPGSWDANPWVWAISFKRVL